MSDGLSEVNRRGEQAATVEDAAEELADALLATGDRAFWAVHPGAVEIANDALKRTGYKLVPRGEPCA